jgi:membrane protein DedA with SNARE-associated domain
VAIVLPIPIEVVLLAPLLGQQWGYLGAVIFAMAAGKTVGAGMIFYLGVRVEDNIRRWSERYKIADRVVKWCERFVRKTNYIGLYVLLSIPLMSDTIPLYLYSLFNEEGRALNRTAFLVANFLAAWTRAGALVLIYLFFKLIIIG